MFARSDAYFQDCRDVYWHFQACHNPLQGETAEPSLPNYIIDPPNGGPRRAMPFVFRCGRVLVLVLESRTERDVFRDELPILGAEQWQFIEKVFANLPPDVETLAVMTPTPIASIDPARSGDEADGRSDRRHRSLQARRRKGGARPALIRGPGRSRPCHRRTRTDGVDVARR